VAVALRGTHARTIASGTIDFSYNRTGVQAGDVGVALLNSSAAPTTVPAGWVLVGTADVTRLYRRVYTAALTGTTVDQWVFPSGTYARLAVSFFTGVDNVTPFDVAPSSSSTAATSTNDALTNRVLAQLSAWKNWLGTAAAGGYVGEAGWPYDTDLSAWNLLAGKWYDSADAGKLWITDWASGRWWGNYRLGRYVNGAGNGDLDTARPTTPVSEAHQSTADYQRGTNLNGPEFGGTNIVAGGVFSNVNPGTVDFDFVYPTLADFQYLAARGVDIVRLAFKWERLQPTRGAALNVAELARLHAAVDNAATAGIGVIFNLHNFCRYWQGTNATTRTELVMTDSATVGSASALTSADLIDLWKRISAEFKNDATVVGYGLMNEPHDLASTSGTFSGTNRYTFNGSVQGWAAQAGETLTADTATFHEGTGSLKVTKAVATSGAYFDAQVRGPFYPSSPPSGNTVRLWVYLDASSPAGTWNALPWWQEDGAGTVHLPDGGAGVALTPGQWTEVVVDFANHPIPTTTSLLAFGLTVYGTPSATGTLTFYVDEHAQGSRSGGRSAAEVWEAISQQVVTALRASPTSDTKRVLVPGYQFSAVDGWATRHPDGWITDPANNFRYEAHHYFDSDGSGTYTQSYKAADDAAITAGYSAGLPPGKAPSPAPSTGTNTATAPAITTVTNDTSLVASVSHPWGEGTEQLSIDAGWTMVQSTNDATTAFPVLIASRAQTVAGSTGTVTGTTSSTGGYTVTVWLLALRPAAAPPVDPAPPPPTSVTATAKSTTTIELSWPAATGATGYEVARSTTPGGPYTVIGPGGTPYNTATTYNTATAYGASTSFVDSGLTPNTTYYYVVRSVGPGGTGANSTEASAITFGVVAPPPAPTGVTAAAASASTVTVTWNASDGATGYEVLRAPASSGPYSVVGSTADAIYDDDDTYDADDTYSAATQFTDSGLLGATTYYYVVRAVNSNGASANSTPPASATTQAAPTVPAAPTNVTAAPVSTSSITVTWTASPGATSYSVRRSTVSGGPYTEAGTTTGTSFTDSGLAHTTTYYYVVVAINAVGPSPNSTQASTSTATPQTAPAAPTGVVAAAASASAITVNWTASSGATSYSVRRSSASGGPYTQVGTVTGTSFTDVGLAQITTYYYVVAAINASGTSPNSAPASATTFAAPPPPPVVVSHDFFAALRRSHKVVARVEVLDAAGRVIASTDRSSDPRLAVVSGSVDVDRGAHIRRTCSVSLAGTDRRVIPIKARDLFSVVSGHELRLSRGIEFADGQQQLWTLGVFGLSAAPTTDNPDALEVRLSGSDRSRRVIRNRFTAPYIVADGSNAVTAAQALIRDRLPGVQFRSANTAYTTPQLIFDEQSDPWQAAQDILSGAGMEVFFDIDGYCVIQAEPDPNDPTLRASFTYAEGAEATILGLTRDTDNEQIYNGVIVTGESTTNSAPVRGEAWDDNPASPTYYLGTYGKVPLFYRSEFIKTTQQATAAAKARLRKVMGATELISFTGIVNAAHREGEIIRIERARSGVSGMFMLDGFGIPLRGTDGMTVKTRKRYAPA
jgi:fibronectin type 3 domain-containing protein